MIREMLFRVAALQRHASHARSAVSIMWKLTASSVVNNSLLALIVHAELDPRVHEGSNEMNWYADKGLYEAVVQIALANVCATVFINLFPPWGHALYFKR